MDWRCAGSCSRGRRIAVVPRFVFAVVDSLYARILDGRRVDMPEAGHLIDGSA
ncbi:MAG: hypothetical protein PVI00_01245 [Desulfobacterales bacterium]